MVKVQGIPPETSTYLILATLSNWWCPCWLVPEGKREEREFYPSRVVKRLGGVRKREFRLFWTCALGRGR